jgi:ribonuclease P protein component
VTKQLGGAVVRNRIRRRLRAAITSAGVPRARTGVDYVVIARAAAETMPFAELVGLVEVAMAKVDAPRRDAHTKSKRT